MGGTLFRAMRVAIGARRRRSRPVRACNRATVRSRCRAAFAATRRSAALSAHRDRIDPMPESPTEPRCRHRVRAPFLSSAASLRPSWFRRRPHRRLPQHLRSRLSLRPCSARRRRPCRRHERHLRHASRRPGRPTRRAHCAICHRQRRRLARCASARPRLSSAIEMSSHHPAGDRRYNKPVNRLRPAAARHSRPRRRA
jgi:hypothetical protein